MSYEKASFADAIKSLQSLLSSDVYQQNLAFWHRAWGMVKQPYTQIPDLAYVSDIPRLLKSFSVKTVLDLGCGSGWLSVYLARQGFAVTGLDISEHAVELGRTWAGQESLPIHFAAGDIADIQFPKASFDAVVANSIFEHLTYDLARVTVSRLGELLVPGGCFIGCFDKVGTGPGEYFELEDGTHVYTDKGRRGMMLRFFDDQELKELFQDWQIDELKDLEGGSRFMVARKGQPGP
jgi:SAM-dependent methyltransferase